MDLKKGEKKDWGIRFTGELRTNKGLVAQSQSLRQRADRPN